MAGFQSALHELADISHLKPVWNDFYRETPPYKRNSSGIDSISFLDFKKLNQEMLQVISDELLGKKVGPIRKRYTHSPLAVFPLEKPGKKDQYRIICIPTITDRLIQKSLLRLLQLRGRKFETDISYGYSREKSVNKALLDAIKFRKKKPWVYKTDIKSFFDEIPREEMRKCVERKIRLPSLYPVLYEAIGAEISESINLEKKKIISASGIQKGKGVRQGLPISPLLSNLYLESFDKLLSASKFLAIRYADDLAIFCESREECLEAHEFCVRELKVLGLEIQPIESNSKTAIFSPEQEAEFLGLGIFKENDDYVLNITKTQIDKIWKKFEKFKNVEENVTEGIKFANLVHRLDSTVNSYKGHYGDAKNYLQFEKNLKKWRRNIYRSVFCEEFNIDCNSLSSSQKMFLHLQD